MKTFINVSTTPIPVQYKMSSSEDIKSATVMPGATLDCDELVSGSLKDITPAPPVTPTPPTRRGRNSSRTEEQPDKDDSDTDES